MNKQYLITFCKLLCDIMKIDTVFSIFLTTLFEAACNILS